MDKVALKIQEQSLRDSARQIIINRQKEAPAAVPQQLLLPEDDINDDSEFGVTYGPGST